MKNRRATIAFLLAIGLALGVACWYSHGAISNPKPNVTEMVAPGLTAIHHPSVKPAITKMARKTPKAKTKKVSFEVWGIKTVLQVEPKPTLTVFAKELKSNSDFTTRGVRYEFRPEKPDQYLAVSKGKAEPVYIHWGDTDKVKPKGQLVKSFGKKKVYCQIIGDCSCCMFIDREAGCWISLDVVKPEKPDELYKLVKSWRVAR